MILIGKKSRKERMKGNTQGSPSGTGKARTTTMETRTINGCDYHTGSDDPYTTGKFNSHFHKGMYLMGYLFDFFYVFAG